jgi:hypothetical protein
MSDCFRPKAAGQTLRHRPKKSRLKKPRTEIRSVYAGHPLTTLAELYIEALLADEIIDAYLEEPAFAKIGEEVTH